MEECKLFKSLLTRFGVLFLGSTIYILYTFVRIERGIDDRNFVEFFAMFFMLGCQQMSGGVLLGIFSIFHEYVHEIGLDSLSWYSANFDFENVSTLTYLFFLKKALEARFFGVVRKVYSELAPGVVLHSQTNKFHCPYFGVQFFFNVGVGVLARILTMVSLFLVSFVPYNPVFLFASFYHNLPLTCNLAIVLFLYAKPAIVDGLVFIVTDKILKRVQKEDCEGEEVLYARMGGTAALI